MLVDSLKKFSEQTKGKLIFDYDLKKTNWFNIGGNAKAFFKPENLIDLINFLKNFGHKEKIFILGAGSNILIKDQGFDGIVIKLGKNFSNISILPNKTIIAGSALIDKKVAEFASENDIGGLEFLSCIPGSIGGGIRMNSGCFGVEFKDILLSVQAINREGKVLTIPSSNIKFEYRTIDLPRDLIFLSASFKGDFKNKDKAKRDIEILKEKKEKTQPTKVKTGGSTFKNPKAQTKKNVWELIKSSVPVNTSFGDAVISEKHSNFFINKNNATYKDMKQLIDFVKSSVREKTGINLDLEIEIVG
ncbi:MAG TPA: UDP-N-acetylmuramate dehydrogenase [Candidatus Pelagibacter bacterium]|jgi:UDP-N-acetylmuramate dehydrogenase|nr:UDP-N-acetylenolpyruvoylglucosamine reductase [Pelagibacteraceae bacterium]HJN84662.1 UDP-N-acetylmuramate dehydrogenase [Candidatus Pelagibacter bacterium]|tara:strand:+ start:10383 stop:11291 length:909 start_codon:yes stop_codon:yes gene_type:complete